MLVTRVYIDGFNLYHGAIRGNNLHWLNLSEFAKRLNCGDPVDKIIYCTAMVSSVPSDPDKHIRQTIYHRALSIACLNLEIVKGQFTQHDKMQVISACHSDPPCVVSVVVRNEKGSDVNLASRLLHDAHMGHYDRAIVVSGDSDLVEPIRLVTTEIGKAVWVRNPRQNHSRELSSVATDYSPIHLSVLRASQFPDIVTDGKKAAQKPARWANPRKRATKTLVLTAKCQEQGCGKAFCAYRYK